MPPLNQLSRLKWLSLNSRYRITTQFRFRRYQHSHSHSHSQSQFKEPYKFPLYGGIVCVGALFLYKRVVNSRQSSTNSNVDELHREEEEAESKKIHNTGPWTFWVLSTLPLNTISRLWGQFNEITLPNWMRVPGYKLYSFLFNCNLEEIKEKDLKKYRNLAEFFYRELDDDARVIDETVLVSPADGKVLHLGVVINDEIEQVKGMTYSLEALLGKEHRTSEQDSIEFADKNHIELIGAEEFANVNGIKYSLKQLIGEDKEDDGSQSSGKVTEDATAAVDCDHSELNSLSKSIRVVSQSGMNNDANSRLDRNLLFAVIYLSPGDYHRFHSPVSWVVEKRRHFTGDLFSVSPFAASKIANLFVLNERVALLGRYQYGFFSMTAVGATNVGSIRINFDKYLQTNTFNKKEQRPKMFEASYHESSPMLRGHPLCKGEQIGGFRLGSTIVLVFEAPKSFKFLVENGDRVKVGQALGKLS